MTIAFDIMLSVARQLDITEGVATGGSSTTIVDTTLLGVVEGLADDEFNGGTAFIVTDAGGAGAAPENETARVTDYVESTSTLTVTSGDFSAAPASGDSYAVTQLPRGRLLSAINAALRDLGDVPYEDDTSLDTTAATREYTIPAAAKHDLRQVWIAQRTSAPWDYVEQHNWRQVKNKSTGDLVFSEQPVASRNIRMVYCRSHPALTGDASAVNDAIPLDYLLWRATFYIYLSRVQQEGRDSQKWTGLMNMAAEYAQQALQRHPIKLPAYSTKFYLHDEPDTDMPRGATIKTADVATS
jgi:hypothetical protein